MYSYIISFNLGHVQDWKALLLIITPGTNWNFPEQKWDT